MTGTRNLWTTRDRVTPGDFLISLDAVPEARAIFDELERKNLYPIYYRLQTAREPEHTNDDYGPLLTSLLGTRKSTSRSHHAHFLSAGQAIASEEAISIVDDARTDIRFADNPLVT